MGRGKNENRGNADRVIRKKVKIQKELYDSTCFGNDHRLSKGKIHCSCKMCSNKTDVIGEKHSIKRKKLDNEDYSDR